MAGTTTVRKRSRIRGGTVPLTLARFAGGPAGSAAGAPLPPLGRAGACPPRPAAAPPPFPPGALSAFFGSAITPSRLVEHLARPSGHPDLLAVGQGLHPDARRLVAGGIHQHHVGEVNRPLALDDPALPQLLGGLLVLLDHVDALHHHPALLGDHAQHLALLAALLALLHGPVRHRLLHRHHHHVAEGGVALVGATHHPDALDLLGPRVVRDVEHRAGLDHDAFASTCRIRHRFSFDSGRVSSTSTRSPTLLAFCSSCAFRRFDRVITRSYFG